MRKEVHELQFGSLLKNGLLASKRLSIVPDQLKNREDFESITQGGTLCDKDGEIDAPRFELIMRNELKFFVQRMLANAMHEADAHNNSISSVLFVLKLLTLNIEEVRMWSYLKLFLFGVCHAETRILLQPNTTSYTSSTKRGRKLNT